MKSSAPFYALLVQQHPNDGVTASIEQLGQLQLPQGDVVIQVSHSSINYKDALASQGHRGVVSQLPHIPGIDCAGVVRESNSGEVSEGAEVLVTGYGLGSDSWGGFSQLVRVPAEWVVPLPKGMTAAKAMSYGTAGFTAAQSVSALLCHGLTPEDGPVLVTGASGGVGVISVAILAKLGFEVVAMSGKAELHDALTKVGASRIVGRDALPTEDSSPMLKSEWAGGIDTVGGDILVALVRSTNYRGCVTACGLVAGHKLPLSVYPFILRGVTLAGIDSAKCPHKPRLEIWDKLAGEWNIALPEELISTVTLDGVLDRIEQMLAGKAYGRTIVTPTGQVATSRAP